MTAAPETVAGGYGAKRVDVRIGDVFRQHGVEAPEAWSDRAVGIAASKYFAPGEDSVFTMVRRVAGTIADAALEHGQVRDSEERRAFLSDLSEVLLRQRAAFNTPVWMNLGVPGRTPQAWACALGSTRMLSQDGLLRLDSLVDRPVDLLTPEGYAPAIAWSTGVKEVVSVLLSNGLEVTATPDHRFVVGEALYRADEMLGERLRPWRGNADWLGHDLGIEQEDLLRLGFLHGDGSYPMAGGAVVHLGERDEDVDGWFSSYRPREGVGRYVPLNDRLLKLADTLGMGRDPLPHRGMPEGVYGLTPGGMCAWLRGLFSANGTVAKTGQPSLRGTNLNLLRGVQRCLLALGVESSLRTRGAVEVTWPNGTYTSRTSYELRVFDHASWRVFSDRVNFIQEYKRDRLARGIANVRRPARHRHVPTVVAVEPVGSAEVYDFNVQAASHVAWANGFAMHNCLILGVDDDMDSIEEGWIIESRTFRGGSGSGVNVSRIRADGEPLSGGGVGSGPMSLWMRPTDSVAGVVKSGGRTRRAAKMVVMDADHPEIEAFIECKAKAERMQRALVHLGYDIGMNGTDSQYVPFQQANNSVRVTDSFMEAVLADGAWHLTRRTDGGVAKVVRARELWNAIAEAAWQCGDPGVQFHDTVNRMNPVPLDGQIRATNPCGEYNFLDDTVCNLASINVMAYLREDGDFDWEAYANDVSLLIRAMDVLVDLTSYPTPRIGERNRQYRTLGLGFTNLGALLMSQGIAYDSPEGRELASCLSSVLQAAAVLQSQRLAEELGAYPAWERNREHQARVLLRHRDASRRYEDTNRLGWKLARELWDRMVPATPIRNAQLSVIAPTGTISFLMDAETTGIEPVLAFEATKHLAGGGTLAVGVDNCLRAGVARLRESGRVVPASYQDADVIAAYPEVFQTALGSNPVSPEGHVRMMAAVQPFVSGAISKTCNLPASATPEDVANIYRLAWELDVKAIAIYRDESKAYQPVTQAPAQIPTPLATLADTVVLATPPVYQVPVPGWGDRKRPPTTRNGVTHKFEIDGEEYYLTVNTYDNGTPCELFVKSNTHGSALGGAWDAFSIMASYALQRGATVEDLAHGLRHLNFTPQGVVTRGDQRIKFAKSPADYIARFLELTWGIVAGEPPAPPPSRVELTLPVGVTASVAPRGQAVGTRCAHCGSPDTRQAGSCLVCADCGETTGCG